MDHHDRSRFESKDFKDFRESSTNIIILIARHSYVGMVIIVDVIIQ